MNKNHVIKNMLWRFAERCGVQGINFVVSIILARVLLPDEYGTIALVTVFITILQVFINGGFPNALIQKKNATNLDFSTIFYFNVVMCLAMYGGLFVAAPAIATFYDKPELINIVRVLGLQLVISGLLAVQNAHIKRNMQFKKYFYSTLSGTIMSAIVGIGMVYSGCGVWALVGQSLTSTGINALVLWFTSGFKPQLAFSFNSLKSLFSYGWKLLLANLINTLYIDLRTLIIGKSYSTADLGFYNKGESFPKLIVNNLNTSIDSVLFPTMAQAQDDIPRLKVMTRRSIKTTGYLVWPCMIGLFACAEPLIELLLTDSWLPSVPYLRLFCISYGFLPMQTANLNAIKALGRSDMFLKLQTIGKIIGVITIFITMQFGVFAIAMGTVLVAVIEVAIKASPNKKFINYSYIEQLKDIFPSMLAAGFMGFCVWWIQYLTFSLILILLIQVILGSIIYIIISAAFRLEGFYVILDILRQVTVKLAQQRKG